MNLGPGKEFDRVRGIMARIAEITGDVSDLGDDCALIPLGATTLAISIDNSLENVHFRTDWLDFKEIGFRAAGSAMSDLAAEGATPLGVLVSLGVPQEGKNGTDAAASEVGIEINLEQIPRWEDVDAMAAVASGEEFELLCTMPPTFGDAGVSAFRSETGLQMSRIGTCLRGSGGRRGGVRLLDHNEPVPLPAGYDHFA
jgi:thiamine monophosphate kinase